MQIVRSQANIVEKVFRDKEGRLVRARFAVYETAGRIKARLLDFTFIETLAEKVLSLPVFALIHDSTINILDSVRRTVSPFFNTELINLTGSKPRAPTF